MNRRGFGLFGLIALVAAFGIVRLIGAPGYTDVYYHMNAATRMASGQGLTDPYIWTYIGALDHLPMPSHLYWMPLTSVIAGISMSLFNAPGGYAVAQLPFMLMFAVTGCVGYWLGWRIGGTSRHAWVAGLVTLFSGFYTKFWGEIDTFAPYALAGSLCLVMIGVGLKRLGSLSPQAPRIQEWKYTRRWLIGWVIAGALSALGHLTRADGILLLIVGGLAILWVAIRARARHTALLRSVGSEGVTYSREWYERVNLNLPRYMIAALVALALGYGLVMLPYFVRNLQAIGSPLPLGGTQSIWFTEYNDLFNYPPHSSPTTLLANGLGTLISSRREALVNNIGTFVAVEGLIIMTPLMLIGWWRRRKNSFLLPFALYALGLHLAMTFVFPFPGYRGGLLHSAAALIPFWAALGVVGLDDVIEWVAKRRRRWNARTAKIIFSGGLVAMAAILSVFIGSSGRVSPLGDTSIYDELRAALPADARILSDDPPELYYYTGIGGASLPNGTPEALLEVARRYQIDYVVIMGGADSIPAGLQSILDNPPDFLKPIPGSRMRVYAIQR